MPCFVHDRIRFCYGERGSGVPFVFQHGLGADHVQSLQLFAPPPGVRLLAFDCRAHGQTRPVGPAARISIAGFADDLLAFVDHQRLPQVIVGGTSMGAAIALNFTIRYPDRVLGLVLSRPAWLDLPRSENLEIFHIMARLIRQFGPREAKRRFRQLAEIQKVERESPEAAATLLGYFDTPNVRQTVIRFERIPLDAPAFGRDAWRKINVPTLVLANYRDAIHPYTFGREYAREIPNAEFRRITSKSVDLAAHFRDVQRHLETFLLRHFGRKIKP